MSDSTGRLGLSLACCSHYTSRLALGSMVAEVLLEGRWLAGRTGLGLNVRYYLSYACLPVRH
jgi:hypothetical protein